MCQWIIYHNLSSKILREADTIRPTITARRVVIKWPIDYSAQNLPLRYTATPFEDTIVGLDITSDGINFNHSTVQFQQF